MGENFLSTRVRRSAKSRKCPECRAVVPAGEQYVRIASCWDGDFSSTTSCLPCARFARRYLKSRLGVSFLNDDEAYYTFGSLIEEAGEYSGLDQEPGYKYWSWPKRRDAIWASLDQLDADDRAYVARERELARVARAHAARRHLNYCESRRMIRGMERCSAVVVERAAGTGG